MNDSDDTIITDCMIDLKNTNILNPVDIITNGAKGTFICDIRRGDDLLGQVHMYLHVNGSKINTRFEMDEDVIGSMLGYNIFDIFGL